MKTKIRTRRLSFIIAVVFILACSIGLRGYSARASSEVPKLLITEILPKSDDSDDAYEYIELYNNSDNDIKLKDYKLPTQNIDFITSKVIPSKSVMLICTRGTTSLSAFNSFYGTSITEDKYVNLPLANGILNNDSGDCILLTRDDGTVVAKAIYNSEDVEAGKSITYKYPDTGFEMDKAGSKQSPTPGSVDSSQVPYIGINVTGIALDKYLVYMDVNQTVKINATIIPATAANKSILWTTNKPEIVRVDKNGLLTSLKQGDALITAKTVDGGFEAYCTVHVNRIQVTGISLDITSLTLNIGDAAVLKPIITPQNATNKQVVWSSSNTNVAEVYPNGIVVGRSSGTATITVRTVDGNYTASCGVKVNNNLDIHVTGVSLDKSSVTLETGKAVVLKAKISPDSATNKNVTWSSSHSDIASVDANGLVYAKKTGTAKITVKTNDGGYTAVCLVTVVEKKNTSPAIRGMKLNRKFINLKVGNTDRLMPIFTPNNIKDIEVTWNIENLDPNNTNLIIKFENGRITGLAEGIAKITATYGEYEDVCYVYVRKHDNGKSNEKPKGKGHQK